MAQRKPYNPYSKYGRRKIREQEKQYWDNMDPDERADKELEYGCYTFLVILVIFIIIALIKSGIIIKWINDICN